VGVCASEVSVWQVKLTTFIWSRGRALISSQRPSLSRSFRPMTLRSRCLGSAGFDTDTRCVRDGRSIRYDTRCVKCMRPLFDDDRITRSRLQYVLPELPLSSHANRCTSLVCAAAHTTLYPGHARLSRQHPTRSPASPRSGKRAAHSHHLAILALSFEPLCLFRVLPSDGIAISGGPSSPIHGVSFA